VYGPDVPFVFYFDFFDFWVPPQPLVLQPEDPDEPYFTPDEPPTPLADGQPLPEEEVVPAPAVPEPPPPPPSMELPPLAEAADFPVGDRSFFAGPRTAVQIDLLDRATGRVLWSRAVAGDADPLDAGAVANLVSDALDGEDWAR
jgi:hypothetical protein